MAPSAQRRPVHLLSAGLMGCGAVMVPWLVVLAMTLPAAPRAAHWPLAWVGLDALEALGLAATGWLLRRGDPRRCLTATATAALLVADAWLDMCTAGSPAALAEAVAMAAFAELPLAAVCAVLACKAVITGGTSRHGAISNQTQVPAGSRRNPHR